MRILLTANASYAPPKGGATRANLVWLEALVQAGHTVRVLCAAEREEGVTTFRGIDIVRVRTLGRDPSPLSREIRNFLPDWVLVSSEDLSHGLLREAHRAAPGRIVYLAHTPQWYPFGPESWNPDPEAAEVVRRARALVAIGRHVGSYIEKSLGRAVDVIHPPVYGAGAWPDFAKHDGLVLMINPCVVKGIRIFLALADFFPALRFGALAGWGTTARDRSEMARRPNIEIIETVPNIDDVLMRARLLLMPSLWYEGLGLIAMEAMLRGLPVIASDSGGLVEAKLGTGYVIPVRPITRYRPSVDDTGMPVADEPEQDLEPWVAALTELTTDPSTYMAEAAASRAAALNFVGRLRAGDLEERLSRLSVPSRLRILLGHNSHYWPATGGGDISNRLLMEALAGRGHEVSVVARGAAESRFTKNGVEVETVQLDAPLHKLFAERIAAFDPDVILTSTDDPAQLLLEPALAAPRARVVHLVRATIAAPFGPDASSESSERAARLKRCDAVVGVSEYVSAYLHRYGGLEAVHLPISLMPPGEPPAFGAHDNEFVTMVNPCAVKGLAILLELARAFPDVRFAAVPGWGTTKADRDALAELENVEVVGPFENIDDLLRRTRVLLAPSLWAEARSRIVVEALAARVPVLAANVGGIPEAMCGITDTLLPVNPIGGYRASLDENFVPVAEVPPQEIAPWRAALRRLLDDRIAYDELADRGRVAALAYLRKLGPEPFEHFLRGVCAEPKRSPTPELSADRRRLLELRRRQGRASVHPWFPELPAAPLRLFAFPWAGAGPHALAVWRRVMPFCPVHLPGRESRSSEAAFTEMGPLIEALANEVEPFLARPYAMFGHSMGAGIAWELTRELRRRGLALPRALVVSSARAPKLRRMEPPAEEREVPRGTWTPLQCDTHLYRTWRPAAEPPLRVPIYAYGGDNDAELHLACLEPWRKETTEEFVLRAFRGGHFYFEASVEEFLATLASDLANHAA